MVIRDRSKDNKTMKLFEIPIYAYSPEGLQKKVSEYKEKHKESYEVSHEKIDQQHMNACANFACSPYQTWQYNHIVGYIRCTGLKIFKKTQFEIVLNTKMKTFCKKIARRNGKYSIYAAVSKTKKSLKNGLFKPFLRLLYVLKRLFGYKEGFSLHK